MADMIIPNDAEVYLLGKLTGEISDSNEYFKLFTDNETISNTTTEGDLSECAEMWYAAEIPAWGSVSVSGNVASASITEITWTADGSGSVNIYGFHFAFDGGNLVFAKQFVSPPKLMETSSDNVNVNATYEMAWSASGGAFPDQGLDKLWEYSLAISALSTYKLRLFTNDVTPTTGTVLADLTECSESWYEAQTMTPGTASASGGVAESQWSTVTFTADGSGSVSVYGYYVTNDDAAGKLLYARKFPSGPYTMANNGDQLDITPTWKLWSAFTG